MWKRTKMYRIMSSHTSVLIYQLDANSLLTPPSFSNLCMEKLSDFCTFISKAFILFHLGTQAITVSGKCESELLPTFLSPHTKLLHKAGTLVALLVWENYWNDLIHPKHLKARAWGHLIQSIALWYDLWTSIFMDASWMKHWCCVIVVCQ